MIERWTVQGSPRSVDGAEAVEICRARMAAGEFETWFESDQGRMACLVTNGLRALFMVLNELGDAGEHVVDPESSDAPSRGYVLSNGQVDDYRERDTVGLETAFEALRVLIDTGNRSDENEWVIDR